MPAPPARRPMALYRVIANRLPAAKAESMHPSGGPGGGVLRRLGTWCAHHFLVVVIGWLVALVALQVLSRTHGGTYSDDFSLPGAQSQQGLGDATRRGRREERWTLRRGVPRT